MSGYPHGLFAKKGRVVEHKAGPDSLRSLARLYSPRRRQDAAPTVHAKPLELRRRNGAKQRGIWRKEHSVEPLLVDLRRHVRHGIWMSQLTESKQS